MYQNLLLAMRRRNRRAYELAALLKVSESTFSKKMRRGQFLEFEKARVATSLGFESDWLFAEATIPAAARRETAMIAPATEHR